MKTQHTPTPWILRNNVIQYQDKDEIDWTVTTCRIIKDAQFIVRACNAHDELVEALKIACDIQHETSESRGEIDCTEKTPCIFCSAIAKAEGKGE